MYYVYILQCEDGNRPTGYTTDLNRRILQHQAGEISSTKNRLPVTLLFYETFLVPSDAIRRQKYFKTPAGKKTIKHLLQDTIQSKLHV